MKRVEELRHGNEHTRRRLRFSLGFARAARQDQSVLSVWLFGRTARDETERTSDTDVVVVVRGNRGRKAAETRLQRLGDDINPLRHEPAVGKSHNLDLKVITERHFRHPDGSENGRFVWRIKRYAVPLYRREKSRDRRG